MKVLFKKSCSYAQPRNIVCVKQLIAVEENDGHYLIMKLVNERAEACRAVTVSVVSYDLYGREIGKKTETLDAVGAPSETFIPERKIALPQDACDCRVTVLSVDYGDYTYRADGKNIAVDYNGTDKQKEEESKTDGRSGKNVKTGKAGVAVTKRTLKAPLLVIIAMIVALFVAVVAVYIHTLYFVKHEKTFLYSGVEYAFENDDKSDGSNIYVVGYNGARARVVIPEYIEGHRVSYVANGAFRGNKSLTSIGFEADMPVYDLAFEGCSNLRTVDFTRITSIGKGAFKNCNKLESAEISASVRIIPEEAFYGCSALSTVNVAENPTAIKIGAKAFGNCTALRNVEFARRIDYSFDNYKMNYFEGSAINRLHLVDYNYNDDPVLSSTGISALFGITTINSASGISLSELVIDSLASIPFGFCENLSLTSFEVKSLGDTFINARAFNGCANLKEFILPAGVQATGVGVRAFAGTALERFNGNMLETIGQDAFRDCASLVSISMTSNRSLQYFGENAFAGCTSLSSVNIPAAVIEMSEGLFAGCSSLGEVRFANSAVIAAVGNKAFYGCSSLQSIEFPGNALARIGEEAFAGCAALSEYDVPSSVYIIGQKAFADCVGLEEFTVDENVEFIGLGALSGCSSLESLTLPFVGNTPVTNGFLAYIFGAETNYYSENTYVPQSLKYVTVTGGDSLAARAFSRCVHLESVILPDTLVRIGESAFYGCAGLTELTIPDTVVSVGFGAFENCTSLETLTIPFVGSTPQESGSSYFSYMFGNADYENFGYVPRSLSSVIVTDAVALYTGAFYGCEYINEITLPDTLQAIYTNAFYGCRALTDLVIPNSVVNIGKGAYRGTYLHSLSVPFTGASRASASNYNSYVAERCLQYNFTDEFGVFTFTDSLKKITVTDSAFIPANAFTGFWFLEQFTVDCDLTAVGENAFASCYRLYELFNYGSSLMFTEGSAANGGIAQNALKVHTDREEQPLPQIEVDGFKFVADENGDLYLLDLLRLADENDDLLTTLRLPGAVVSGDRVYDSYEIWQYFLYFIDHGVKSIEISANVTAIGRYAFADCLQLERVVYAAGSPITEIADCTFSGDVRLYEFVQPERLARIGDRAFSNCSRLKKFTVPRTMSEGSIGYDAFYGCERLFEVYNLSALDISAGSTDHGGVAKYARAVHRSVTQALDSVIEDGVHYMRLGDDGIDFWAVDYYGSDGDLALVPFLYNGRTVDRIGIYGNAFRGNADITKLTLSRTISRLGAEFSGCHSVTEINWISDGANEEVEICSGAFSTMPSLQTFISSAPVSVIGPQAFNTDNLSLVQFNARVGRVSSNAFSAPFAVFENVALNVSFTEVGTIDSNAFSTGATLRSVTASGPVNAVGPYAFANCNGLTSVRFADVGEIGEEAFARCAALESAVIGNTDSLGANAFAYDESLKTVNMGNVAAIGREAFANDTALTDVRFGNTQEIGESAFAGCGALRSASFVSLRNIGARAFIDCASLVSFTLGGNEQLTVGVDSFYGCASLTAFEYSGDTLGIDNNAFYGCVALGRVALGNVGTLGQYVFDGCNALTTVVFDGTVGTVSEHAFSDSGLTDITFGGAVDRINRFAFASAHSLQSVTFAGAVNELCEYAFAESGNVRNVTFGGSLNSMGVGAFSGCFNLEEIALPDNLTEIKEYSFSNCNNLHKITLPRNLRTISRNAFEYSRYIFVVYNRSGLSENQIAQYFTVPPILITNNISLSGYTVYSDIFFKAVKVNGKWYLYSSDTVNGFTMLPEEFTANEETVREYSVRTLASIYTDRGIYVPNAVKEIQTQAFPQNCVIYYIGNESAWNGIKPTDAATLGYTVLYYSDCVHGDTDKWRFDGDRFPTTVDTVLENYTVITTPTCVVEGIRGAVCPHCGDTIRESMGYGPHNLVNGRCTVCNKTSVVVTSVNINGLSVCRISNDRNTPFTVETDGTITSENHTDGSSSSFTIDVTAAVGITFEYDVSSERNYDRFIVEINGTEVLNRSGDDTGVFRTELAAGDRLVCAYIKDGSQSYGRDNVIIKNLTLIYSEAR